MAGSEREDLSMQGLAIKPGIKTGRENSSQIFIAGCGQLLARSGGRECMV